jgi:hypothetical protein
MIELRFHPSERSELSTIDDSDRIHLPTAYITLGSQIVDNVKYDVTTVSLFYQDNMATGTCWRLFPTSTHLGYHPNDIEHISIYSTQTSIDMVYFSAHSPGQGMWLKWKDCELSEAGSLIVYVARNSHACYPHAGTYWRLFGLANDVCSNRGKRVNIVFSQMLSSYDYAFSNGIRLYRDLRPMPPLASITPWQRFFILFYKDALRI